LIYSKKAFALSLTTAATFILVLVVVGILAGLFSSEGPILASGPLESAMEIAGIGKPRILSFNVERVGTTADFRISYKLAGGFNNIDEVNVFQRHKQYPEGVFQSSPNPVPGLSLSDNVVTTLQDHDGRVPKTGAKIEPVSPGYNVFTLSVVTKKGEDMRRDVTANLYNEKYLEEFDSTIDGCTDGRRTSSGAARIFLPEDFGLDLKGCNVMECKRVSNRVDGGPACFASARTVMKEVSIKFRNLHIRNPRANSCGRYHESTGARDEAFIDLSSCSDTKVGNFSLMASRIYLMYYACKEGATLLGAVNNLDDIRLLSETAIQNARTEAHKRATACVNGISDIGGVQGMIGLKQHLKDLGFQRFGGFNRDDDVNKEFDEVIDNLPPTIADIRADAYNDRHIGVTWTVYVGSDIIKSGSYKITQFIKRWERGETTENQKLEQPEKILSGTPTSFNTDPGQLTGRHYFEVRMYEGPDATESELFFAEAATGLFDDAYVETAKGGITGCVTKGDPTRLHECNVDAQKREELKALRTPSGRDKRERVFAAFSKANVETDQCEYSATGLAVINYGLKTQCTPEEVDRIWMHYLIDNGNADDYDCVLSLSSEASSVCIVKRQLVETLTKLGWKDLRTNKGWEQSI